MKPSNIASGQVRVLKIIKALKGHSLTGLSNAEIAKAIDDSPTNVTRAMESLIYEGFALKFGNNERFALSIQMESIAMAHMLEIERTQSKAKEHQQNVLAGAKI